MPFLLRKVKRTRWLNDDAIDWLPHDEPQADAFHDLTTGKNTLSFWEIEDDQSNLQRIIAAMAANCDALSNIDYVLVDRRAVESAQIELDQVPGETVDAEANRLWHYDLVHLSAAKLLELARHIKRFATFARCKEPVVLELIARSVASTHFDVQALPTMREPHKQKIRDKARQIQADNNE